MQSPSYRLSLAVFVIAGTIAVSAQTSPPTAGAEETITLSPFEVRSEKTDGYRATSSLSATRLNTPTRDLPFNVQIVTEDLLQDLGRQSIEESLTQVSNVTTAERNRDAGPDSALIGLRGFKTGVILRNGVKGFYPDSMADVQRVEVIKGPTALYGVSDPGGVVNYITKQPLDEARTQVRAQVGSYDLRGVSVDVNQPLEVGGKKAVLFRAVASYDYNEDIQPYVNLERTFVEPMLTFRPTSRTTLNTSYSYSHRVGIPIRNPSPFLLSPNGKYQVGFVDVPRDFTTANPGDDFYRDTGVFEASLEQRLSENWVARASYIRLDFDSEFYGVWTGNAVAAASPPYYMSRIAVLEFHEARLSSFNAALTGRFKLGPTRHTVLIGLQNDDQDRKDWNKQIRPSDPLGLPNVNITNPSPDPAIQHNNLTRQQILDGKGIIGGANVWRTTSSETYYFTDEIRSFNDRLILLAALRHVKVDNPETSKTSPQIGATWRATKAASIYASYSTGLQPNTATDDDGNPFDPEKAKAWEAGVKVEFNSRLSGTIAAFHIARENIVVQDGSAAAYNALHPNEPPRPLRYLGGTQESDGFEADLIFEPVANWQTILSYGYQDARTTKSPLQKLPNDPAAINGLVDIVGLPNEGSAKNNAGLWTRYKFDQGVLKGLALGGGGYWREGPIQLFPTFQNRFVRQEGDIYELSFFANYTTRKLLGRETTFGVNVTNLTDEVFWVSRGLYVQPRKVLFSMRVVF